MHSLSTEHTLTNSNTLRSTIFSQLNTNNHSNAHRFCLRILLIGTHSVLRDRSRRAATTLTVNLTLFHSGLRPFFRFHSLLYPTLLYSTQSYSTLLYALQVYMHMCTLSISHLSSVICISYFSYFIHDM
jgi:hypothetical protein